MWIILDDELTNTLFSELPEKSMIEPFPKSLWRVDALHNGGYPWHELLSEVEEIHITIPDSKRYIHIYDYHEPQYDFQGNGLAVLNPISGTVTEALNGSYELELTHPIDEWSKWENLVEENIIKTDGQLFRIYRRELEQGESGAQVSVNARHISYDLNGVVLDCSSQPVHCEGTGQNFINAAWDARFPIQFQTEYNFSVVAASENHVSFDYDDYPSFTSVLFGNDHSFANLAGCEVHRDNFYISLFPRKEGAKDNAFNIRYKADMTKIKMTVDYSDLCSFLACYDNSGNYFAIGDIQEAFPMAYRRAKVLKMSYTSPDLAQLSADCQSLYKEIWQPKVEYEVEFAQLKNDPYYKDFMQLQDYNVGDTGHIRNDFLKIDTDELKIIEKKTDLITGRTISVTLANKAAWKFVSGGYMGNTASSTASAAEKELRYTRAELKKLKIRSLGTWGDVRKYKWQELTDLTFKNMKGEI